MKSDNGLFFITNKKRGAFIRKKCYRNIWKTMGKCVSTRICKNREIRDKASSKVFKLTKYIRFQRQSLLTNWIIKTTFNLHTTGLPTAQFVFI